MTRSVVMAAASTGAIRLMSLGLSFLFFVAVSRAMTAEGFGTFSVAFSIATLVGVWATVGQHVAVLRFWPVWRERFGPGAAATAIRHGLALVAIAGIVLGGTLAAAGSIPIVSSTFDTPKAVFYWMGLLVVAGALAEFNSGALRAQGYLVSALAPRDILWRLVVIASTFVIGKLEIDQAIGLASVSLLLMCLPQVIQLLVGVRATGGSELPKTERLRFSASTRRLWASSALVPIVEFSTTIAVGVVLGPLAAGAYFACDRLSKLLSAPLVALEQLSAPKISRDFHSARHSEVRDSLRFTAVASTTAAAAGCAGFVLVGPLLLGLFNSEYSDAYPALLILSVGYLVHAATGSNALLLNMSGREADLLRLRFLWGLASPLAGIAGALLFGLLGAAAAASAVLIGSNIHASYLCYSRLHLSTTLLNSPANSRK